MAAAPGGPKSGTNRAASSASARGGRTAGGKEHGRSGRGGAGKARGAGGKELMIAAGILGLLMLTVVFYYFLRSNQKRDVESKLEQRQEMEKSNWKLAKEKSELADQVGHLWIQGGDETSEDKLKAAFASDESVYNVIFERKKKDKRGHEDSKVVPAKDGRMGSIGSLNFVNDETSGLHMEYAYVEGKTIPVVKAVRNIGAKDGDPLNLGGTITVLVLAKEDEHFKNAKNAVRAPAKEGEGGAAPATNPAPDAAPEKK